VFLLHLEARDFRNYRELHFEPHPSLNIVRGQNAQGKSNFIEALYYSLRGFSYRAAREVELIRWEKESALIKSIWRLVEGDPDLNIRTVVKPDRKEIQLNGRPVRRGELVNRTGVVLFTPEDLWLIKGGPEGRRRFLDRELGVFSAGYLEDLQQCRRALTQRNALLRQGGGSRAENELWTEQVCRYGARILSARLKLLRDYVPLACRLFNRWVGEDLNIRYQSSVVVNGADAGLLESNLAKATQHRKEEELRVGQTLSGPHRDDLQFLINGRDARSFASQGRQRAIILALKLAQVRFWQLRTGKQPVILLDDVLFELDAPRRQAVLEALEGEAQVFLTVGDAVFESVSEHKSFYVTDGNLREEG
jgi:DNA replication and repair protein RecF